MKRTDISHLPEALRLAEEVQQTRVPQVLQRGGETLAVLSPVGQKRASKQGARRRAKPIPRTDSLFGIVGLINTAGPNDVSENKHKYLAEAYSAEFDSPNEE